MVDFLAENAKIYPGENVLDIGCGMGGSAFLLAERFGARVTGVDVNTAHIIIAQNAAKNHQAGFPVVFRHGDLNKLEFNDDSFDVIWLLESMDHACDRKQLLDRIHKMLKPGGRLVIADLFRKCQVGEISEDWRFTDLMSLMNVEIFGFNEFNQKLKESEFKNIRFCDITKNVMPYSRRLYLLSICALPFGKIIRYSFRKPEMLEVSALSAFYRHHLLKKRAYSYAFFVAEK